MPPQNNKHQIVVQNRYIRLPPTAVLLSCCGFFRKKIKTPTERIQGQLSLHDGGKAVDSFPHVRISGKKIHVTTTSKITEHFSVP